jgi:hypothetical protein
MTTFIPSNPGEGGRCSLYAASERPRPRCDQRRFLLRTNEPPAPEVHGAGRFAWRRPGAGRSNRALASSRQAAAGAGAAAFGSARSRQAGTGRNSGPRGGPGQAGTGRNSGLAEEPACRHWAGWRALREKPERERWAADCGEARAGRTDSRREPFPGCRRALAVVHITTRAQLGAEGAAPDSKPRSKWAERRVSGKQKAAKHLVPAKDRPRHALGPATHWGPPRTGARLALGSQRTGPAKQRTR